MTNAFCANEKKHVLAALEEPCARSAEEAVKVAVQGRFLLFLLSLRIEKNRSKNRLYTLDSRIPLSAYIETAVAKTVTAFTDVVGFMILKDGVL